MVNPDYNFYLTKWAGSVIPAPDFAALITRAARLVDYVTDKQVTGDDDDAKRAACAAAEELYLLRKQLPSHDPNIKSESVDGVSVSYTDADPVKIRKSEEQVMYRAIQRELSGTGLLYRGC